MFLVVNGKKPIKDSWDDLTRLNISGVMREL